MTFQIDFLKQYYIDHKCCPKCGCDKSTQTYLGIPVDSEHPENYKDTNICICDYDVCNHKHTVHDRVPAKKITND